MIFDFQEKEQELEKITEELNSFKEKVKQLNK
jgi:hypothetical protein